MERHGAEGEIEALRQMQALSGTPAAAIVRVESNVRPRAHRALDMGAHGIMFPHIDTAPRMPGMPFRGFQDRMPPWRRLYHSLEMYTGPVEAGAGAKDEEQPPNNGKMKTEDVE